MKRLGYRHEFLLAGLVLVGCSESPQPVATPQLQPIQALMQAFNRHDPEAMLAQLDPEIEWISIVEEGVRIEARGHVELAAAMGDYFMSVPTVRSEMESHLVSGAFVSVRERASWKTAEGERSQASLSVYQLRDGKILRVWYFPVDD